MKQFYSIVKLSPNVVTQDSVAIGIILYDSSKFWHFFSTKKKNIVAKLLNNKATNISTLIKQIELKCNEINEEKTGTNLIGIENKLTNSNYFDYLKNYANGLLQFSNPTPYFGAMDEDKFNQLVNTLFNEEIKTHRLETVELPTLISTEIIERKLINKVKDKVHTNYKLTKTQIPELFFSTFEMDCIGLNGAFIGAKSLSFDKTKQTLDTNLGHYFTLISTLSSKYKKPLAENSFYLIAKEPQANASDEHKLWESVYKNELITVIDPEESNIVADLIFSKDAKTFLD